MHHALKLIAATALAVLVGVVVAALWDATTGEVAGWLAMGLFAVAEARS